MKNDAAPTIRPLAADDAEAYRTLRLATLAETPEAFGASHAEEAAQPLQWFADGLAGPAPNRAFGAFSGAALIGSARFVVWSRTEKSRHKGLLVGVQVAPTARGRGIGALVVEAVIAHARQHVVILQVHVGATNRPAYRLYERLGFRPFGLEPKALLIDGVFYNEALLALDFSQPEQG